MLVQQKASYEKMGDGLLFGIAAYRDGSYVNLPDYHLSLIHISKRGGAGGIGGGRIGKRRKCKKTSNIVRTFHFPDVIK